MFSRTAARVARQTLARRTYATSSGHAAPQASSDAMWMIGSAAVFVPTVFYLTRPPATHAQHSHTDKDAHVSPTRKESTTPEAASEPESAPKADAETEPQEEANDTEPSTDKPASTTAAAASANAAEKGHSAAHEMKTTKQSGPKDVHEAAKSSVQTFKSEKADKEAENVEKESEDKE